MAKTAKRDLTRQQQLARGPVDLPFLALVLLLLGIGLVMLLSASSYAASIERVPANYDALYYFKRQAAFAAAGLVAMYFASKFDYQLWRGISPFLVFAAILLLIAVLIPGLGNTAGGATRWLKIGPITFQPSELAKLAVIMFFSATLCKRDQGPKKFKTRYREPIQSLRRFYYWSDLNDLMGPLIVLVIIAVLMLMQPHLSGTILIFAAAAAIFFAAGIRLFWFGIGIGGISALCYVVLVVIGYNGHRIQTWKDPWWDPLDKSMQVLQSILAVASGGLSGLGLGESRQKYSYLPEEQNDFIFAIVCEELGFIGATLIIVLFALLIIRGYWLALHARDRFGSLVIIGINTLMAVQVFLNIAVVTNLIPATGVSLPFFSYGGTALMMQLGEMGIILSVSRQIPAPPQEE